MKIGKKKIELQDGLEKEWILSNGIGGFCSTTILGANTRRYHGLLIAPLIPPAQRHLILSKVDENITIGDENFGLYTNLSPNYVSEGYKYLESFEKDVLPVYTFKVKDVKIVKTISMIFVAITALVLILNFVLLIDLSKFIGDINSNIKKILPIALTAMLLSLVLVFSVTGCLPKKNVSGNNDLKKQIKGNCRALDCIKK